MNMFPAIRITLVHFLAIAILLSTGLNNPRPVSAFQAQASHEGEHIIVNTVKDTPDILISNDICGDQYGYCSLRAAVQNANLWPGGQTIVLASETYTLTRTGVNENAALTGDLDLTGAITITGNGLAWTVINANHIDRVLEVRPGAVVQIYGLTLSNGQAPSIDDDTYPNGRNGGGILNAASLTMGDVGVYGNHSGEHYFWTDDGGDGGGIYNYQGTMDLSYVEIKGNETADGNVGTNSGSDGGDGAGLYSYFGSITMDHCVIEGNITGDGADMTTNNSLGGNGGDGGGLYVYDGVITTTNTLFTLNSTGTGGNGVYVTTGQGGSGGHGGAIFFTEGELTMVDSTVYQNTTGGGGSGCKDTASYNLGCRAGTAAGLFLGGYEHSGSMDLTRTTVEANINGPGGDLRAEGSEGGGIYCYDTTLSLTDSTVIGNVAGHGAAGPLYSGWGGDGGGLYLNACTTTITRGAIRDNYAGNSAVAANYNYGGWGGGLRTAYGGGTLTITDTTISGNHAGDSPGTNAGGFGGGLYLTHSATLTGVTLSSNQAGTSNSRKSDGGGIYSSGAVTIVNSTVSGNTAGNYGGIYSSGTLTVQSSTIVNNSATYTSGYAGGIAGNGSVRNSIIANNTSAGTNPDCMSITSLGYNLVEDTTCTIDGDSTGVITGLDPQLGPLQDNGGPTFTHMLLAASPAIDAANPAAPGSGGNACPGLDQRNLSRNVMRCDMGALEAQLSEVPDRIVRLMTANIPVSFGPHLAIATLTSGDSFYLGALRTLTPPGGVPDFGNHLPAFWEFTQETGSQSRAESVPLLPADFSFDLSLCYTDSELGSTVEDDLFLMRWNGTNWIDEGGVLDSAANCLTKTGVTTLSTWTLGTPLKTLFLPLIAKTTTSITNHFGQ